MMKKIVSLHIDTTNSWKIKVHSKTFGWVWLKMGMVIQSRKYKIGCIRLLILLSNFNFQVLEVFVTLTYTIKTQSCMYKI